MPRNPDKTKGLSFTEIAERLHTTLSAVRCDYDRAIQKMKAIDPEVGAYLLERLDTEARRYAEKTAWKPQSGQGEGGGRFEQGIPQLKDLELEPAREELPEELWAK